MKIGSLWPITVAKSPLVAVMPADVDAQGGAVLGGGDDGVAQRARCWCRSGRDRRTVSARRWSSTAVAGWRRWHDLPSEGAPGRDNDQLPVTGAHCEGTGVRLLKNAQDVGDHLAATSRRPAPPDHDPLADIGGCEPDL